MMHLALLSLLICRSEPPRSHFRLGETAWCSGLKTLTMGPGCLDMDLSIPSYWVVTLDKSPFDNGPMYPCFPPQ